MKITIELKKKNLKKLSYSKKLSANVTPLIGGGTWTATSGQCDEGQLPTHFNNCHPKTVIC